MQNKLNPGKLLDSDGSLLEKGYATSLVRDYKRSDIKASPFKIKEWDYYYIGNKDYGIALTVGDNSYISSISVSFLDFTKPMQITKSKMLLFTMGKLKLPSSSKSGDVVVNKKGCTFRFLHEGNKRHLIVIYPNFYGGLPFSCDIYLKETNQDSMVVAIPFNKKKHFYYNQKINLLESSGHCYFNGTKYDFSKDSYGVLDWGRGVWTYKNTWYWSSLNTVIDGEKVGFNLGYGFGDTSAASENMFFYHNQAYKFEDVVFDIPKNKNKDNFMLPWKVYSKDKKINLTFSPLINRRAHMSILVIKSLQDQVFGEFNGTFTLENGEKVEIKNALGFAEKVTNWW